MSRTAKTAKRFGELTPRARQLIKEFDEAAASHGWQQDQGSGEAVEQASKTYTEAKGRLETYVLNLQKKAGAQ